MCGGEGEGVVGEGDIQVSLSREIAVNSGYVGVGHQLAEHDRL